MGEALVNNLGSILTGGALFLTALVSLLNLFFTQRNRREISLARSDVAAVEKKVDGVDKKVDGGMSQLQAALADVATTTTAAMTMPRSARRTDKVESEP